MQIFISFSFTVRFQLDQWNKLKNSASKEIGEKMKVNHFPPVFFKFLMHYVLNLYTSWSVATHHQQLKGCHFLQLPTILSITCPIPRTWKSLIHIYSCIAMLKGTVLVMGILLYILLYRKQSSPVFLTLNAGTFTSVP